MMVVKHRESKKYLYKVVNRAEVVERRATLVRLGRKVTSEGTSTPRLGKTKSRHCPTMTT